MRALMFFNSTPGDGVKLVLSIDITAAMARGCPVNSLVDTFRCATGALNVRPPAARSIGDAASAVSCTDHDPRARARVRSGACVSCRAKAIFPIWNGWVVAVFTLETLRLESLNAYTETPSA